MPLHLFLLSLFNCEVLFTLIFVSNQSYLNKSNLFQKRSLMHHKTIRNIVLKVLNNLSVHRLHMAVLLYLVPCVTFCITCICMEITHFRTLITRQILSSKCLCKRKHGGEEGYLRLSSREFSLKILLANCCLV